MEWGPVSVVGSGDLFPPWPETFSPEAKPFLWGESQSHSRPFLQGKALFPFAQVGRGRKAFDWEGSSFLLLILSFFGLFLFPFLERVFCGPFSVWARLT